MTNLDLRKHLERLPDDARMIYASPNGRTYSLDRIFPPAGEDKTILLDTHDSEAMP